MNVVVLIDGREAVPVRAVPLLTNWEVMSPDVLAEALAQADPERRPGFHGLVAYSRESGTSKAVSPSWWENFACRQLTALSEALKRREDAGELTHEEGYQLWRSASLQVLPEGVFVWKDELSDCFQREYGSDRWTFLRDGKALSAEQAAERTRPDFAPFVSKEMHALVMEGLGDQPQQQAARDISPGGCEDQQQYAIGWYDQTVGAAYWFGLAGVNPTEAAQLLSRENPHSCPPDWLESTTWADDSDGRPTMEPRHKRELLRGFQDAGEDRPLVEWLNVARARGWRYDPWIDAYIDAAGEKISRPPSPVARKGRKLSDEQERSIAQKFARGHGKSVAALADEYKVDRTTVDAALRRQGAKADVAKQRAGAIGSRKSSPRRPA